MLRTALLIGALFLCLSTVTTFGQQAAPRFGSAYASLDQRRQQLINDWVSRFVQTTGQSIQPGPFYDDLITLSTKTTFDAVTHALMTSRLTDTAGAGLGDVLSLVERVETVQGEVEGARGDRQFRMYARLTPGALEILARSREFKRGEDNSVYHKGYPINYREQSGVPSIQVSIALDHRRADIDVDYRASSFPAALFNGHLTSSNSDVRAGDNYDKHLNRWAGFENWWRSFFGVRQAQLPDTRGSADRPLLPPAPRAGKQSVDTMADDFLKAWLIDGDIVAAMGYVSHRSYACLAQETDAPADFDRGMAPFQMMINLKSARESLGSPRSLDGLVVGTRLTTPGVRVVRQPHHARFVVYDVPDDMAADFDCESALTPGDPKSSKRTYGNHFGTTFYVGGGRDLPVTLLWAREDGYWKIVSWRTGTNDNTPSPMAEPVADPAPKRIAADPSFVRTARAFLDNWLVRRSYDAAFESLSPKSHACYDIERGAGDTPSTTPEEAGRKLRVALQAAGDKIGRQRSLAAVIEPVEPVNSAIRVMDHPDAHLFSVSSIPNALADALECAARAAGTAIPDPLPLEYGNAFVTTIRFKTLGGAAPVLRLLWRREAGTWRITSYGIEMP